MTCAPRDFYVSQRGLTITETALIVIVFGLIVGGALKGCEIMRKAEITNTVKQIQQIDSAVTRFDANLRALPGDIADAPQRVPNCDASCRPDSGVKNNRMIDSLPGVPQKAGMEAVLFWRHLAFAELLDFVNEKPRTSGDVNAGDEVPRAAMGGAIVVGHHRAENSARHIIAQEGKAGHYLALTADPGQELGHNSRWPLAAGQLRVMDQKLDDGKPNSGAFLVGGNRACVQGQIPDSGYSRQSRQVCTFYFRISR